MRTFNGNKTTKNKKHKSEMKNDGIVEIEIEC